MTSSDLQADRREQLETRLAEIHSRIDRARESAGRTDSVHLVVVTKNFPASDVDLLAGLGVRDVGENRDQEAKTKKAATGGIEIRWHMIGRLQRNKVGSVARWADIVESVDRMALIEPLAAAVARADRPDPLDVLIQVNVDPSVERRSAHEAGAERGGALPHEVSMLAEAIGAQAQLHLAGVMAVAPHPDTGVDPLDAFSRLARVSADLRARWPQADIISAGMSHDLEQAVACGATQVRIGGAILGPRPAVQ